MLTRDQVQPIGGFCPPAAVMRQAASGLRRRRMAVSEAAARYRRLSNVGSYVGPWRNENAPYLVEPMDACDRRDTDMVVVVGPSQFGKTEIPLNLIVHGAMVSPADMLIVQPTRDLALDFADRRIGDRLLAVSPRVAEQLGTARGDDKADVKAFRNGLMVSVAWPTTGQLSSRPIPKVIIDERDSIKDQIGDEGDPVTLARARTKTFGSNGLVYVSSSPKRLNYSGIMPLFDEGDRRLWYWPCPDCGEYFAAGFALDRRPLNVPPKPGGPSDGFGGLSWPAGADPDTAADRVSLICPHCGSAIEERSKAAMNARGVWLADGETIDRDGVKGGVPPRSRVRSYWFCGIASNFASWGAIAAAYVKAAAAWRERQDDQALRAVVNTDFGFPYVAADAAARPVTADDLADRAKQGHRLRQVPAFCRFLVATVDVQADRFEVAVWGYAADYASALVDRFAIRQVEVDGERVDVRPAEYPEQWDALTDEVLARRYALAADPGKALRVASIAVDTGGLDGVAANAYGWFLRSVRGDGGRKPIARKRLMLVKGNRSKTGPLVSLSRLERVTKSGAGVVDLHVLNVHEIKSIVSRRLRRADFGPGAVVFPTDAPERVFAELTGETLVDGEWRRHGANETFDLAVYGAAAAMALQPARWGARLPWFCDPVELAPAAGGQAPGDLVDAAAGAADQVEAAPPVPAPPARRRPARRNPFRRSSWVQG